MGSVLPSPLDINVRTKDKPSEPEGESTFSLEDSVGDLLVHCSRLDTPAFVYDEEAIVERCEYLRHIVDAAQCNLLYSIKPLTFVEVLRLIAPYVDGFSVSSLFEAALVRAVAGGERTVHLTTPGLKPHEIGGLAELCDYISLNSLSQWDRHKWELRGKVNCGLRINPQRSFVSDPRHDPCRQHSKLGVPIQAMIDGAAPSPLSSEGLNGLHIHTNCDSPDLGELLTVVRHLDRQLGDILPNFEWINLGGGYLFEEEASVQQFIEAVAMLRHRYGLRVYVEPGAAIVREACYLVSTVLDIFPSDGRSIAILDTSVNHVPEVFEYQYPPDVVGVSEAGGFSYTLAGSTCLAGDIFGEYSFTEPLAVGSRIVFADVGAYTLVKAHTFNGLNYPTIYVLTAQGDLVLKKRFTYEEYAYRWGMVPDASDPNGN